MSAECSEFIKAQWINPSTYDHRTLKTRLPVRSALFKQRTGGLVVRWVTTSEYPLLYVFVCFFLLPNLITRARSKRDPGTLRCSWKEVSLGNLRERLLLQIDHHVSHVGVIFTWRENIAYVLAIDVSDQCQGGISRTSVDLQAGVFKIKCVMFLLLATPGPCIIFQQWIFFNSEDQQQREL
jgi:hypothetical protein